jgi:hypothetical protein
MALCLGAGLLAATLAANAFTLAWTHSIEKIRWEEDWLVGEHLQLVAARVRGSGAGMEPPAGAELRDGVWHYRPNLPALETLTLSHSPHAGEYTMCVHGKCRPLSALLPGLPGNNVVKIAPCAGSTAPGD